MTNDNSAEAVIEDNHIVIRVPIDNLGSAVEGAWAAGIFDIRYQVTDPEKLARALVYILNKGDDLGTTRIHHLFDEAINEAIEQGEEGIDEHPEQRL